MGRVLRARSPSSSSGFIITSEGEGDEGKPAEGREKARRNSMEEVEKSLTDPSAPVLATRSPEGENFTEDTD
jgi:hypothetical protein